MAEHPVPGSADSVLEVGTLLTLPPSDQLVTSAFAEEVSGQSELTRHLGLVDLAHSITLAERGVIPPEQARLLVAALMDLHNAGSFVSDAALGDLYTNREAYIAARTSAVGWLGVARARREALTTAYHLLLCERLIELAGTLLEFGWSVAAVAERHTETPMPDYTYLQAAQPTSFGHYLSGFAWPILRDLERLQSLYGRADLCPAGSGSMNGSVIFQDRAAQARRLGCAAPLGHARDAMWQPDLAIEAMALAVAAAINLDRLSEDLMIFATAEFGFVHLSDRHARASKIMPQKRNPYALAYIRGLANRLIGEQAGVAASGRTPTGQMDNRMLPYGAVPAALRSVAQAASLMGEVVSALQFDSARARSELDAGSTSASDLAERLCLSLGFDFRSAHAIVARLVRRLSEEGRVLSSLSEDELQSACRAHGYLQPIPQGLLASALDPLACLEARRDIGGAAPGETRRQIRALSLAFAAQREWMDQASERRRLAEADLMATANAMIARQT